MWGVANVRLQIRYYRVYILGTTSLNPSGSSLESTHWVGVTVRVLALQAAGDVRYKSVPNNTTLVPNQYSMVKSETLVRNEYSEDLEWRLVSGDSVASWHP